MNTISIPKHVESVLLYLHMTTMRSARTSEALKLLCPDERTVSEATEWLIRSDLIEYDGISFDLTFEGHKLVTQLAEKNLTADPILDELRGGHALPTIETHPLRSGFPTNPLAQNHQTLHFMLAFALPKNILPTPVVNGDVIGRAADVNIRLCEDEFISSRHCRFRIVSEQGKPALSIEDLGSRNGTRVNSRRLDPCQPCTLAHGDQVQVGNTILIVVSIPY